MTGDANAVVTSIWRKVSTEFWAQALAGLGFILSGITVSSESQLKRREDGERGHVDFFLHCAEIFL